MAASFVMAPSASILRDARKNRQRAERHLANLDAQLLANQQIAQQVRDDVADSNRLLQSLASPQPAPSPSDPASVSRHEILAHLASAHDILRESDQRIAELLQLRDSANKIIAQANEIIRQAAEPPSTI